ncbi:MAG: Holliday junction resolvase RuvX, partial [Erythrobacter sp.]|nr:Holliday junction resolvase RuvX [Erythrobacter sp.]
MAGSALVTEQAAEFREALPFGGALLGLDLGEKTVGIALCDARWTFATAGKTLARGKFGRDKAALEAICKERSVAGVVIGLPLNMDGSSGPRAQASRAYARNLAQEATGLGLPVLLWDERWSTASA